MSELSDADWEKLARDLSARVAVFSPEWTDSDESDPGITLLQLFAFLTESLLSRPGTSPRGRARRREIIGRLERADELDCDDSTLTRNRYFTGRLLSADDLRQEQSYVQTKHRRHNRLLHGVGIARGLAVSVDPSPAGGDPTIVISPGVAISPDGEELVLCEPVTLNVCKGVTTCYVTLGLRERPTDPAPAIMDSRDPMDEPEYSRIEESANVGVSADVPTGHLAIARLRHAGGVWRTDPSFKAPRIPG